MLPSVISPSNLSFNSTPIWIQILDMPMYWHIDSIVTGIASKVGNVLEIDKYALLCSVIRSARVCVLFMMIVLGSHLGT